MKEALEALLKHYIAIADSGDCGSWDPEKEDVVIQARAALKEASKMTLEEYVEKCEDALTTPASMRTPEQDRIIKQIHDSPNLGEVMKE